MLYDVIVVGGGPAGSTAAREAAAGGARVLLLEKAAFPRDKPCGGGVNLRAAALLPFALAPVVERTIASARFSFRLGDPFTRHAAQPLTYMTQRARLDAFLVEHAVAAGVELHERDAVRAVEPGDGAVTVRAARGTYRGRLVIGADGANGVVARATGLMAGRQPAVAFEGNVHYPDGIPERWRQTIGLDLGLIPGGYGWLFPKGDHVNIGVGGWQYTGPRLRALLARVATAYGASPAALTGLRGYHLPVRTRGAPLVRGRVALAGDAAGLIDPFSREGIYGAIYSGRSVARHALATVDGRAPSLGGYADEIESTLGPDWSASAALLDAYDLAPRLYISLLRRSAWLWDQLCRLTRGEVGYASLMRRSGPAGIALAGAAWMTRHSSLGRLSGHPRFAPARHP